MSTEEDDYRSSDDEDYVPEGAVDDDVDEPSGDECDEVTAEDDPDSSKRGRGRRKPKKSKAVKEVAAAPPAEEVDDFFAALIASDPYAIQSSAEPVTTQSTTSTSSVTKKENVEASVEPSKLEEAASESTTKITEVFDFAGQEIKVEKEVTLDEAKAHEEKQQKMEEASKRPVVKRVGLGDALTMLTKKPKMSVLDKSNLDWKSFKQEEKIEEDLATHNRGKNGYLNKQEFLMKADYAQFEKERAIRDTIRKQNQ
ncbi:hypothetical protein PFISCL1PPCAC_20567 [Pristionchus fissidentatus]|uniref:Craniofacial development protein 1 n=1 Tax=Pristionchus fissidentatus TaxID=1538716 RepID=A0AAV5WC40_9BILA|nr:hypothetical protein PFISCL1PPCAC_20567 [Pristionchus fissidentatus]